ncbi:hypothetical protein DSL72_005637 [Monilinia vaccinii-corymbosi]|uniref:RWD domain-containing protein n=1 Tax=Monilinia vaccinii-corymbosi TaxID=61207 RepID=A0A8A3PFP4_9HELO|nr:hypothetical protein DSL72_005637 [Monilinia vaccinii-corymbosi]
MSEDLLNEIEAINSIYGADTLVSAHESPDEIYVLALPNQDTSLRIQFPADYPNAPPAILGTQSSGGNAKKGDAAHLVEFVREVVGRTWRVGEVCLYDICEEVDSTFAAGNGSAIDGGDFQDGPVDSEEELKTLEDGSTPMEQQLKDDIEPPNWTLSEVVTELKSVFVARSTRVHSPALAACYIRHLLGSDRKIRSATHNITAWRIKTPEGIMYQDCDDDGESAAGGRVLHLMQLMDLWNVMVVVTRWYGGQKLGARRFAVINRVARDSFVKGGFVEGEGEAREGKRGKR